MLATDGAIMSWCERHRVSLTTDTTSGVTAYTTGAGITGRIQTLIYTAGTAAFSTTCDLTISTVNTSQVIYSTTGLDASEVISPRMPTHNTTGGVLAGSTAAAAGSLSGFSDYIYLHNDQVKVTVVNAGTSKNGTVDVIIS